MAQQAAANAQKRMDSEMERRLAKLIMEGSLQLAERAEQEGVLAYCRRPLQREKPNENFLQRTLRNVSYGNRRVLEEKMWAAREKQLSLEERMMRGTHALGPAGGPSRGDAARTSRSTMHNVSSAEQLSRGRSRRLDEQGSDISASGSSGDKRKRIAMENRRDVWAGVKGEDAAKRRRIAVDKSQHVCNGAGGDDESSASVTTSGTSRCSEGVDSPAEHISDADVMEMLARHRVRGRGEIGSRADEPGPYLPLTLDNAPAHEQRSQLGPAVPPWIRQRQQLGTTETADVLLTRTVQVPGTSTVAKEDKQRKRKRDKKEKKEKRNKKEKKSKREHTREAS